MEQLPLGAIVPLRSVIELPPAGAVSDADPPQFCKELAGKAGDAITTSVGKVSVRETWVNVPATLVLLIVIVSTLVSPIQIVLGTKDLVTVGAATPTTVTVALAGVVLVIDTPPPVELSALAGIVLIRLPRVVEVTLIPTVHSPGVAPTCAGTVPPLSDKVVVPGTAVTVPLQVLETLEGFAINKPGCTPTKLSVQEALLSGKELGLKIVTFKRDVVPVMMEIGVKLLLISAGKDNCWAYTANPG